MTPPSSTGSPPPSTETAPPSNPTPPPSTTPPSPSSTTNHIKTAETPASFTVTCPAGLPAVAIVVRLLTLVFLLISLILTASNTISYIDDFGLVLEVKFNYFYVYRYMLASIVIGLAYTLVQSAFTIFQVSTGNRLGGDTSTLMFYLDFYGDKVISYMLATGAAAGFGFTVDANRIPADDTEIRDFLNKANAAASLLIVGFLFSATSSVFSSLALPKRA